MEAFLARMEGMPYGAETFPVFFPNLGPEVYSAFYGAELEYGEDTAWSVPMIEDLSEVPNLELNFQSPYWLKVEEMMDYALERSQGRFLVGYTDLHPGLDCLASWRDPQNLCLDMAMEPEAVEAALPKTIEDYHKVFSHYHEKLDKAGMPSVSWMGLPFPKPMHIPGCDFAAMLSPEHFERFNRPILEKEAEVATYNVFHLDGPGLARHLDVILEYPKIGAIQWVQGSGSNAPIAQWFPLVRRILDAGRPVKLILQPEELEAVMETFSPEGILLYICAQPEHQEALLKKVEKWK